MKFLNKSSNLDGVCDEECYHSNKSFNQFCVSCTYSSGIHHTNIRNANQVPLPAQFRLRPICYRATNAYGIGGHALQENVVSETIRRRQGRQRSGQKDEKGAVGRRWFCWCQKGDPPLRIALKETDAGLASPSPLSPTSGQLIINLWARQKQEKMESIN